MELGLPRGIGQGWSKVEAKNKIWARSVLGDRAPTFPSTEYPAPTGPRPFTELPNYLAMGKLTSRFIFVEGSQIFYIT